MTLKQRESLLLETSSPKIDYDVAIVGAGPVGLATALGLRQRGIEKEIKERFLHSSSRIVTIKNNQIPDSDVPRVILFSPQPCQFGYSLHGAFP
ncbi:MAG: FAD-dependent monooxygenase, partial [Trichodesmium sp. MAG_R04]|nr:FAD-dependent monooxygenase [Trichodesmium sp. MAG_R04]